MGGEFRKRSAPCQQGGWGHTKNKRMVNVCSFTAIKGEHDTLPLPPRSANPSTNTQHAGIDSHEIHDDTLHLLNRVSLFPCTFNTIAWKPGPNFIELLSREKCLP